MEESFPFHEEVPLVTSSQKAHTSQKAKDFSFCETGPEVLDKKRMKQE